MLLSLHDHADLGKLLTFGSPTANLAKWVITILRRSDLAKFYQLLECLNVDEVTQLKNFHYSQEVIDAITTLSEYQRENNVLFGNALTSMTTSFKPDLSNSRVTYFTGDNNVILATRDPSLNLSNVFIKADDLVALVGLVEGELPKAFLFKLANIGCEQVENCRIDTLTISTSMDNLFDMDFFNTFEKSNLDLINPFYSDSFSAVDLLTYIPELTDLVFDANLAVTPFTIAAIDVLFTSTLNNLVANSIHNLSNAFIMPTEYNVRASEVRSEMARISTNESINISDYKSLFISLGHCIMNTIPYYRGVIASGLLVDFDHYIKPKLHPLLTPSDSTNLDLNDVITEAVHLATKEVLIEAIS